MTALRERQLEISLPANAVGRRFDGDGHGLSHCMKAVDFIVELPNRIYFIEIKDPDESVDNSNKVIFRDRLISGKIDGHLKLKFRDSWIYEWSERRVSKPVFYLVLIAIEQLTAADLTVRKASLDKQLPLLGPGNRPWQRKTRLSP